MCFPSESQLSVAVIETRHLYVIHAISVRIAEAEGPIHNRQRCAKIPIWSWGCIFLVTIIAAASDERDLRALKSLHFEELSGARRGQHSVQLNKQFRLTLEFDEDQHGKLLLILAIEDYH
jgi:plasmid maintenance system killer protein